MSERLKRYFYGKGIEYYAVLDYSDCIETVPRIRERAEISHKSLIIYLLPYYVSETVNLSRYAASLDYHLIIKEINDGIFSVIKEEFPGCSAVGYGDHSPIDERHAALTASLGILGDNGLLINEKYGSYVFIGDVVTDVEPGLLCARSPGKIIHCESCGACRAACPTGILRGEGGDCLSAITQRKGLLDKHEISMMKQYNTVWGCDVCQSVCPHNIDPTVTPIEFFHLDRITHLTKQTLAMLDGESFERRAFAWRKRATVERNVEIFESEN